LKGAVLGSQSSKMARLLLPNGQYQMVDIQQAGIYHRYSMLAYVYETSGPMFNKLFRFRINIRLKFQN